MTTTDFFTNTKEIIVTLSALVGIFIAYKGLEKWKQELVGKTNFDTAKSLLKATYKTRKAIHTLRRNWILREEYNYMEDLSEVEKFKEVFSKRLQVLDDASQELEAMIVEGQALWGKEFEKTFSALNVVIDKLRLSIDQYIVLLEEPNTDKESVEFLELKATIFHVAILDQAHESFAHNLYLAIKHIEDEIRKRLK